MIDWFYEYCCNIDGCVIDCIVGSDCLRHEERSKKQMSSLNAGKLYRTIKRFLVPVPTHDGQGLTAFVLEPGALVMVTEVDKQYGFITKVWLLIKMKEYSMEIKSGFESTYFEEIV